MNLGAAVDDFGRTWAGWFGAAFRWVAGMEQKKKPSGGSVPKAPRPYSGRQVPITEWDREEDEQPDEEPEPVEESDGYSDE